MIATTSELTLKIDGLGSIEGVSRIELNKAFRDFDEIRQIERMSILRFMESKAGLLYGKVLDYGAGTEPYKHLVTGQYYPFHKGDHPPAQDAFDAVMCNQVIQYVPHPRAFMCMLNNFLKPGGHLIMTYPTNWDEVEMEDLWRFTEQGMLELLTGAGFDVLVSDRRAQVQIGNFRFPLGYGVVAQKLTA